FDMSVYETLGILAAGGAVVIPRPEELRDPAAWAALCRRHGVTLWNSAPALLGMLADHAEAHPHQAPAGLRLAFLGGDWVPVPLVERVRAWAPAMRDFIVMGGATEASIHSIIYPVHDVDPAWSSIPYGVPMANQRAWVLDRHLREVPAGVAGELFLGGIGLARGYTGRAGFTAERFLPNPHGGPGSRIYRTGDLARYGVDGTIELLGRIDHQLKIRGFRIEPGEIETALRRHPAIARAVAVAWAEGGESRLVAYLVPAEDAAVPAAAELRALLRETLPDYMVPAAFVTLDRLPLSPNGKVDRGQLPAPPAEPMRAEYVAPRTPAEAALAEIWAEVLGADGVGADDDFFALGGHSLSAARVAARVRERMGVQLALGEFFRVPTLGALAAAVDAAGAAGAPLAPIPAIGGDGPFALAPAQRRLWLWQQMKPAGAAYNIPVALRLRGPVDAAVLERALGELVARHSALRTVFAEPDGEPVQVIAPAAPFVLPVEDLSADAGDAALRGRLAAEAARPFDLAAGPLFRALLLKTGDEEHVLLLTVHHVVFDGWSTRVLLRELAALYDAFGRGEPSPLEPLPLRYADYAAWHRARVAEVEEAQLAWWRDHLAGAPELLELPLDRPRPAVQSHRGAQHPVRLPAPLVERTRALARGEGATLHMVVLAALNVVLARHARAGRVVIGSAAAGRTHPDTEALAGFFVNTLPIHADLLGDPDFRAFLRQVRARTLDAYDRQDVPFDRLVEAFAPGRSRSHEPLVQVALAWQEAPARGLCLGSTPAEPVPVDLGTAQFDLTFLLDEDEAGVSGVLEYATDLFDAATAERMVARLRVVLEAAVAAPGLPLSRLPLIDAGERARVEAWAGTGERFAVTGGLHQRFEARAAERPTAVAVTCQGESLTYGELNTRANRLARRLRALGVGPESRVGLCAERSLALVAGVLAIVKAGAAYVPLDPAYPADRLAFMAEDSGIRVLLAQSALRDRVAVEGVEIVSLEEVPADELAEDLGIPVSADNLAYVIYTSGSTGRPKGVGVTHANVLRLFDCTQASFGFGAADVWTLFHSYAFDFSVWEIWGALLHGSRLVVVPWAVSRDPAAFRDLLRRDGVTVLNQTPSAFRALCEADEREPEPLTALRTVVFGGEALNYQALRGWLDRYGPRRPRLVNMYGITETTVHVTWHTVTGRELRDPAAGSGVGIAIPDLRAYVLDPAGNPCPAGIPGELHVGGAGLARGYLGRPGLTAQRFVPDPFSGEAGARLYRSGDLARWKADGTLEYLGRIDQQVKVRGFRIELGEIESTLLAHPSVAAAAVIVRGKGEDAALVAYVVPSGEMPPAEALRDALKRDLPGYMVPAAFVAIDRIPLTANGKLDRKALPEPGDAGEARVTSHVEPRTPVEAALAEIWAQVLRRDRVGVTDDFFALGGHSLLATRAVTRISQALSVQLSVAALFDAPTIAQLAVKVEAARAVEQPAPAPLVRAEAEGATPLSFAQERLWFLDRLQPGSAFYNHPRALRIDGPLHVAALERALGEIVRRHEPLRTTFAEAGYAPVQVVALFAGVTLVVEEVADEAAALRRAAEEAARPFDLATGPLFRPTLWRWGGDAHLLLVCMHHVVTDGWSTGILYRELEALYAAFRDGGESPLPAPPVRYADYAAWQHAWLRGDALERQLAYWRRRLADAPALLELPTDHPRPAVQSYGGAYERIDLPPALLERLRALGQGQGATLYMVLLAAFQLLLGRYAGADDVVVGSPIAGRTRAEFEELIGFFVNTLVLRADLSGDPDFAEVLRRVRAATLGAYEHQDVPFERLVEELAPERSLGHSPLFQVMFSLEEGAPPALRLDGARVREIAWDSETVRFDLALTVEAGDHGFGAEAAFRTDLFERATIRRMLGHLARVLEQVADDPSRRASALELMGDEERGGVLAWSHTVAAYPTGPIHPLIEARAAATPDALAVVHEGERLTYAQVNGTANRLARELRDRGIGRGACVPVLMERGAMVPVAMLAAVKAGAAFVPLDPKWPDERLHAALDDLGAALVIAAGDTAARAGSLGRAVLVASVDGEPAADLGIEVGAADPIYAIYTSGSTGKPKAAVVAHAGIANRFHWMSERFGADSAQCVLQTTRHVYDSAVWQLLWPLVHGGRTVVPRDGGEADAAYLVDRIEGEGVTMTDFVPSVFNTLVPELAADPGARARLASLRTVVVGGEQITPETTYRFMACFPGVAVINLYGPTECAIGSICHQVTGDEGGRIPIGTAIPNTGALILDAGGRPCLVGVPGEIHLSGRCVGLGYLNDPRKTAAAFVPDPYSPLPGARMYRTGDLARHRADGSIDYLGRRDHQVKIRGFRIEPGEIEAALRRLDGVRDCAVIAQDDARGEKRLVAYVVGGGAADELRAGLKARLPEYMVPAAFVALDALPLTANGKLDRKALPAPDEAEESARYAAPRTPVEQVLAGAWATVLGRERVGIHDGFFELGGHSLLATRVISRVRQLFGVEVPLRALFEAPTVAELAERVEALRRLDLPQLPPVLPVARDRAVPLSFAQERLWFLDRLQPGSALYNVPDALRLSGALDVDALERALGEIVRRHEALRTVFRELDGGPVQVIAPFEGFSLPVEDLSTLDATSRAAIAKRRVDAEAVFPFDLSAGPLFRARLIRLGDEEHLLLLSMHHTVSDGWSSGLLRHELSVLYTAFCDGRPSPLADLPVQYADYVVWQRGQLRGEVLERQLAYWRERLAGAPTLLELPTDRPRPAVQTYRGAGEAFELSAELSARLEALARAEGATLYMVLLGAYQALLARYSRGDDVVVGSPAAGRTRGEVEELIGFFVHTLVLRTSLSGDPSFRDVLARVREATLGAYEHQDVPFENLVEALQPERSLGHNPLFQAFFALPDVPGADPSLPGLTVGDVAADIPTSKFDLSLFFTQSPGGLRGYIEYATDLFDAATVRRFAAHLEVLLEAVAADPARPLSSLPIVTRDERETIVRTWAGAGAAFPVTGGLHQRFEACAAARPDAVAVTCDGEALKYGELNARANRLARRLRALGVRPESRVGLCAERSLELVVGVLAIVKAGAAYVPLDPAYPADRLAYMAEDSGIRVLLAQSALRDRVSVDGIEVVALEDVPADELPEDLGIPVSADNLAYVIYTSGSTGRPKGVGVTQGNVLRLFDSTQSSFGFGAADVWTLFHSYAFDFSVWEIWGALLHGGRLVVVPWTVSRDPAAFRELLRSERVTVLNQTPSAFRALCEADEREPEPLTALRTVVFGGEALNYQALRGWLDRYGPRRPRLVNMYGITETTVHVTWHTVTGAELRIAGAGSGVGTAIPDLRAYILDPAGNPCPAGVPGELHVGGAGLARGYLGRPGLTAQRFVPDPFSGDAGARLYRSGDLARWKADGTLEYLGRIDQQVKVRGFRIELGEIESTLLAHPSVAAAAVIVRGEGEDAALVAYVVPNGEMLGAGELRDALRRHLPEYMVPAAFVAMDRIPLTANGKLDRRALPEPDAAGSSIGDGYLAPRTPVEEVLAAIWCEVLGAGRIGTLDDFFELGGHSLRATQVVARIRETFGVGLPLRAFFEGPTVAELAARVEALRRVGAPVLPPVVATERAEAVPLSFGQERLWFLDRLSPGTAVYNHPVALRIHGALNVPALERALGELVRRHHSLRTTFAERDGGPVQVVAPFGGFTLPVEPVAGEAEAARRAGEEAARPFDLTAGPLFRPRLLAIGNDAHVLLLCMHHVVADGWSLGVLFRELHDLYAAYRDGADSPLAEPALQYADHAAWQRTYLRGDVLDRQVAWWKERLAGAPALIELPTDRPRRAVQSYRGAWEPVEIPAGLMARLEALGRGEGATPFMVLLGAWQMLLARYAGTDDVVVGTTIAGRTRRETEALVGLFMNTLALRADLSGDPAYREVLRRVRRTTLDAYDHQDVPFERLVAELRPERTLSHAPLFQVLFELHNTEGLAAPVLPGLAVRHVDADTSTSKYDLTLALVPGADGVTGSLTYSAELWSAETIRRMLQHYRRVLEEVAANADVRLSRLALIGAGERAWVVDEWNRTGAPYPADRCIHQLFEARAAATPHAVAVTFGDLAVTYRELDERANRLAHHLVGIGIGPEVRVGLCLERGPELMAAILGVMKAGGAYVPVDPAHPAERIGYVMDDSGVAAVVTQDSLRPSLPLPAAVRVVSVDGDAAAIAAEPADAPRTGVTAENLCYVIYTSGSTGRPKGVAMHHRGVCNYIDWGIRFYGADRGEGAPVFSSMAVDLTITNLLPLFAGRPVRFLPEQNPVEALAEVLREKPGFGLIKITPIHLGLLTPLLTPEQARAAASTLVIGADFLAAEQTLWWQDNAPGVVLMNEYGPTETVVGCSAYVLPRGTHRAGAVPVGHPIQNLRFYLLDAHGEPVPVGLPGELYIGGAGVARGYLGRPALTAEKFVPDPFAEAGARMYRTGDRARWLADGNLLILGRTDNQVKIRGYRVELGEIEAALRRHPSVSAALVVVR
ncbi:MAG TPA: amino acid adenylation domain-containing protein, partial [Longimicrobium sp.]|nr:amino acid adenylation domain-containing protein [Longimicrobium sp.]